MSEHNIWGPSNVPMYAPPTESQVALMTDPRALIIARRISAWAHEKPAKEFYRYPELVAAEMSPGPSESAMAVFLLELLRTGLLIEKRTANGLGSYYVKSVHTWPWVQCALADPPKES